MSSTSSLFAQHSREWRENLFVYPVVSRRARGLSIGINLSPDKSCTFRCVYCSVDRRLPGRARALDPERLASELDDLLRIAVSGELFQEPPFSATPEQLRRIRDIAFSGDGEPTASPHFAAALGIAVEALERRRLSETKLVLITNATLLHDPQVAAALSLVDRRGEIWAKLDAGTEEHFRRIDRSRVPFERVLENLLLTGRAHPLVMQSMFVRLGGVPPSGEEIEAYLGRLRDLQAGGCRVKCVQVYTSARATAEPGVSPLSLPELEAIALRLRGLGLDAETFGPA
jgi:wyosine [tRNA(Phe)-imidazoG37] synthetase (radical SAM superfamily)